MTATYQYFESPFLDEGEPTFQVWRPAFPEDEEERPYIGNEESDNNIYEDTPEVLSIVSYEGAPGNQAKQEDISAIFDDIEFSDCGVELADLQNIDINIFEPRIQKKGSREASLSSLFPQEVEQPFLKLSGEGRVLSTKKYEGNRYDEQWIRRLDKTIAARAFVYRGYGINYLKEQLRTGNYDKFTLDQTKYKSISGSMTRQAYRRLQSFLMRDCQRKLHTLSGYQMKLLQTLLLNCRSTLSRSAGALFLQIVRVTFSLEDTSITESEATVLYEAIYRSLQRKISLLRGHSAPSQRSSDQRRRKGILGQQGKSRVGECESTGAGMDRQIIKEYMGEHSISKMRDSLRSRRVLGETATVKTIRNVLRRVLRSTIRRMENLLNDGVREFKQLKKMTDDQIKWIIQSAEGLQARRQLCRIHLQEREDRRVYESVYRELRLLVQKKDSLQGIILQHGKNVL